MPDKYSAVWVSHTSLNDFLQCPRAYFLKNVYKDPNTGHKVQLITPQLALGASVHEVIESLSQIPTKDRFKEPLIEKLEKVWKKFSGKRGGFTDPETEAKYKLRAEAMLRRVTQNPGPLATLAVKIKEDLPQYWISEQDNIILCGKVDWLEYLPDTDSVNIIDFKTGKNKEDDASLQLPIYHLLVHNTQHRKVAGAGYWYIDQDDHLTPKTLPDLIEAHNTVLAAAKKVKIARQLQVFKCPQGDSGCFACKNMESVVRGDAELVGVNDYNQDMYILTNTEPEKESMIL